MTLKDLLTKSTTISNKVVQPSIALNVPADSPMAQTRMTKRVYLLCLALQKPGITAERKEALMDELMAKRYLLNNAGFNLPKDPSGIIEALALAATVGGTN